MQAVSDPFVDLKERLEATLAAAGASGSWDWDIPGDRLYLDARMSALYGIPPSDGGVATETFFMAIHPEDVARIKVAVAGVVHGAELFAKSYRLLAADGTVRWMQAHGRCFYDDEDRPKRFSGILVDVTARRRTEEQLRIAQTAGGVGTFEHVAGYATATVSEQFCRVLGLNPATALPVATINSVVQPGYELLLGQEEDEAFSNAEICIVRRNDGEHRWITRRGETVCDAETAGVRRIGVIYDITEAKRAETELRELNDTLETRVAEEIASRQQMEEALRQSQKMEAVGQLTGGIAHDFNNLLTVIIGNVDMAARRLGDHADPRIGRALENAAKGAERASTLTQRLLAFSRRQPLDPKPTDIGRLLRGMADLLTRSIGESVRIEMAVAPDLWRVEVDPNQLENALLNLAVNARDAMDGDGILRITAGNESAVPGSAAKSRLEPGGYVSIAVADSGSGMSPETIERAFDPFFTTKEVGKGTGLGLSMVYGFVKQSGGDIQIRSAVDQGTTVTLYLPRLLGHEEDLGQAAEERASAGSFSETVLVVEDDADVRAYTVETLAELGYQVLEASDGAAAVRLLERQDQPLALVLTDVVMPGMSGREVAEAARAARPGIKILYTSGYPREAILNGDRLEAGVDLLPKPFTYQDLAAKVRDALDH